MDLQHNKLYLIIAMMTEVLAFGTVANAQTQVQAQIEARLTAAVNKVLAACGDDLNKYCSTVTPGGGRGLLCLQAHEDKISTKCEYALFDASRNLQRSLNRVEQAADVCWSDIEKNCSNIPQGGGRIAQCLVDKKASLTPACQSKVSEIFPSGK
jgi:hypothetical protein